MKLENIIYCRDNLSWLKKFPDNCEDVLGLFLFELFEGQVKKTDLYHK